MYITKIAGLSSLLKPLRSKAKSGLGFISKKIKAAPKKLLVGGKRTAGERVKGVGSALSTLPVVGAGLAAAIPISERISSGRNLY